MFIHANRESKQTDLTDSKEREAMCPEEKDTVEIRMLRVKLYYITLDSGKLIDLTDPIKSINFSEHQSIYESQCKSAASSNLLSF